MNSENEKLMKNKNTTEEIRKLCECNPDFKAALEKSLSTPITVMEEAFRRLSLKGVPCNISKAATDNDLQIP